MLSARRLAVPLAATATTVITVAAALLLLPASAHAASSTVCGEQSVVVSGGGYGVQNDGITSSVTIGGTILAGGTTTIDRPRLSEMKCPTQLEIQAPQPARRSL